MIYAIIGCCNRAFFIQSGQQIRKEAEDMNMITLKDIQKSYGTHQVLKDVNLNINQGEIYGLIGKNGVGKTTIFKIILGLSEFEHGKISVAGSKSNNDLHWNGWASLGTTGCRYFISSIGCYLIPGHIKEENAYTRSENCLMIRNCLISVYDN